jgi:hypothetical protein
VAVGDGPGTGNPHHSAYTIHAKNENVAKYATWRDTRLHTMEVSDPNKCNAELECQKYGMQGLHMSIFFKWLATGKMFQISSVEQPPTQIRFPERRFKELEDFFIRNIEVGSLVDASLSTGISGTARFGSIRCMPPITKRYRMSLPQWLSITSCRQATSGSTFFKVLSDLS